MKFHRSGNAANDVFESGHLQSEREMPVMKRKYMNTDNEKIPI